MHIFSRRKQSLQQVVYVLFAMLPASILLVLKLTDFIK